jgi:protein TonB
MNTSVRACLVLLLCLAGLNGCSSVQTVASSIGGAVERLIHPFSPSPSSPSVPPPIGLDSYKTQVAQHVLQHNPEHSFNGKLPPMLPAIVVLEITVDEEGRMTEVAVQRSRDPDASQVALASMRRSAPLPRPARLANTNGKLTFSETFLFADRDRYQLRSLAGPQTVD